MINLFYFILRLVCAANALCQVNIKGYDIQNMNKNWKY